MPDISNETLDEVERVLQRAHENTQSLSDKNWRWHVKQAAFGIRIALASLRAEREVK
jgi:O-succinylbenzoate synthase